MKLLFHKALGQKMRFKKKGDAYEKQKKDRSKAQKLFKVEQQITRLEKEIKAIDLELEINYDATIATPNFFDNYQQKKKKLERLMEEWENLQY